MEAFDGLYLGRFWLHTLKGEHCTVEADLWLPYLSLAAVKNDAILHSCLYQLHKVSVMLLWDTTINADIVVDCNGTWELVSDLVHAHFEDVLAHLKAKEPVPAFVQC